MPPEVCFQAADYPAFTKKSESAKSSNKSQTVVPLSRDYCIGPYPVIIETQTRHSLRHLKIIDTLRTLGNGGSELVFWPVWTIRTLWPFGTAT